MSNSIKNIIKDMTLEEKASLCSGADFWHTKAVERLGVPAIMVSDGPHGLRKQAEEADHLGINDSISAVCFPAACATAASFDVDLIREMGETIGNECQAENVGVVLGPAVNIKRSPLCGRNFEYFSEDPFLAGEMAASYINGVQSQDVGTSIKHFAVNNQEYRRMSTSAEVSERALHEIYFPAFEIAVKKSQPWTVMCSYNKINGTYASDNKYLLTDVLRDMWGFEGFVMTDWGAVDDRVQGIKAGLELEMPGPGTLNDNKIVEAVKSGALEEDKLDAAVEKILEIVYRFVDNHGKHADAVFDRDKDHDKAVRIAGECAVLLQNNGVLPIATDKKVAYIGGFAKTPRYQGGGSSHINSSKVVSALDEAIKRNRNVEFAPAFPIDADSITEKDLTDAIELAKSVDVAVIFAGLPDYIESEGYDRADMKLPSAQIKLIEEIAKVQKNTVVVLHNGSPIEADWADNVGAILEMYLGGQGVGEATDKLLFGEISPSGHLAESFPCHLEDNPSYLNFPGDGRTIDYAEGVYVGYRYYDTKKLPVRWAFGHGLSYTTFKIDNLKLSSGTITDNSEIEVFVDVTNTGNMAGKEVVQLYVSDHTGTSGRPVKELKGFKKVSLNPGETKTVSITIDSRSLAYWNSDMKGWYAPSGNYEILVGDSSDHILCSASVQNETKVLPPFKIDGATTIEELATDPRTAKAYEKMMNELSEKSGLFAAATDKENPDMMLVEMIKGMPLKSLASFGVDVDMEAVIETFQKAVGSND